MAGAASGDAKGGRDDEHVVSPVIWCGGWSMLGQRISTTVKFVG